MNNKIISPSALDWFMKCPFRANYQERGSDSALAVLADMGKENHALVEKVLRGTNTAEEEARFLDVFGAVFPKIECLDPDSVTEELVEGTFALTFNGQEFIPSGAGDWAIHGVMDWMQTSKDRKVAQTVDWKTGRTFYRKADIEDSWQEKIYSLAVFLLYPYVNVHIFKIAMTQYGAVVPYVRTREDLPELQAQIASACKIYREAIATNNFPICPGTVCNRCSIQKVCTGNVFWKENKMIDVVSSPSEWEHLLSQYLTTQNYLGKIKDQLDAYAYAQAEQGTKVIGSHKLSVKQKDLTKLSQAKAAKEYIEKTYGQKLGTEVKMSKAYLEKTLDPKELEDLRLQGYYSLESQMEVTY